MRVVVAQGTFWALGYIFRGTKRFDIVCRYHAFLIGWTTHSIWYVWNPSSSLLVNRFARSKEYTSSWLLRVSSGYIDTFTNYEISSLYKHLLPFSSLVYPILLSRMSIASFKIILIETVLLESPYPLSGTTRPSWGDGSSVVDYRDNIGMSGEHLGWGN